MAPKTPSMRAFHFLLLLTVPTMAVGQTHSIDDHDLFMSGTVEDGDISINTYFNAIDEVEVQWSIVEAEVPEGWEFSFCFPNCHPIGVEDAAAEFPAASEQYLNCHVYPNGVEGEGHLRMLLTTNGSAQDTVTWWATIGAISGLEAESDSEIKAFPLPFRGQLNLEGIPPGAHIAFYDQAGARIHEIECGSLRTMTVDLLPQGLFYMTTTLNGEVIDRRRVLSL